MLNVNKTTDINTDKLCKFALEGDEFDEFQLDFGTHEFVLIICTLRRYCPFCKLI